MKHGAPNTHLTLALSHLLPDVIEIEIHSQPVFDAINRLLRAGQDMNPVMHAIGKELETKTSNRFETQTDPTGAAWAPWKASTLKTYPKNGNRKKLDRYGDLLDSLTYQADADSALIGFCQPYAEYHEMGTKHMVRRSLLTDGHGNLGAADERSILDILNAHFARAITG